MKEIKLPNFILAGFPKCGSSSLYYYLKAHPEIFLPEQKELHYYVREELKERNKGPGDSKYETYHVTSKEAYNEHYRGAAAYPMVGDSSASFMNHLESLSRVKAELGDIKIILTVRDPVKRAYSNYLHLVREGRETLDFMEALEREAFRKEKMYANFWYYLENSKYYDKIKLCKTLFSQVYILTFEAFTANPQNEIQKLYRFLDVDDEFLPDNLDAKFNTGGSFSKNLITRLILRENALKRFVKKNWNTNKLQGIKNKVLSRFRKSAPVMDPAVREMLRQTLKEDVLRMHKEFGVEIKYWQDGYFIQNRIRDKADL